MAEVWVELQIHILPCYRREGEDGRNSGLRGSKDRDVMICLATSSGEYLIDEYESSAIVRSAVLHLGLVRLMV